VVVVCVRGRRDVGRMVRVRRVVIVRFVGVEADLRTAGAMLRDLKSPTSGVRRGMVCAALQEG
jgi:hypothetical protein